MGTGAALLRSAHTCPRDPGPTPHTLAAHPGPHFAGNRPLLGHVLDKGDELLLSPEGTRRGPCPAAMAALVSRNTRQERCPCPLGF